MTGLSDRVALVTGSTRGIGLALAEGLACRGLSVVVTGRNEADLQRAVGQLMESRAGRVEAHLLDVTDPATVFRCFAETERAFGRLDVLVNSAGIAIDRNRAASAHDMEKIQATLNVNLLGAWRCSMEGIGLMRKHGYGRIINVSSGMASLERMKQGSPAYRVSKAALNALTRVLADEVAGEGILVNSASPGVAATRMTYEGGAPTPTQAAESMLWLATTPNDGPSGRFFEGESELPW